MKMTANVPWGVVARVALIAVLGVLGASRSPVARADTTVLKGATTMVFGSASDTYSFTAPSAGTVTAEITNVPWPEPLAALSYNVTSATGILSPMMNGQDVSSSSDVETYQVGAGTYFAHISATASSDAADMGLGLYSVMFTFTPTVPLPAAAGLLFIGMLVVFGLRGTLRGQRAESDERNESVMSAA